MSRSNYSDDGWDSREEQWRYICYRGAVNSAIKGKQGQAFLKEMLAALDAMPEKKLIAHELELDGQYCAMGVVGKNRGLDLNTVDAQEAEQVAKLFGLSEAMVREIAFMNDDEFCYFCESPEENRWRDMRKWIVENITNE